MRILKRIKNLKIYKTIFGYDIFISYSRMDSMDYAYAISKYFIDKGYECYIDQLSSSTPGKELPKAIKSAVSNSTEFILIGSKGAKNSEPIKNEIDAFLNKNQNKPFIRISINNEINNECIWFELIDGLPPIDDSLENLQNGIPDKDVLVRIESALKFTKKSIRLRQIATSIIIAVLVIVGSAIIYTSIKVKNANQLATEAKHQEQKAKEETSKAYKEKLTADSLKIIAFNEKNIADKQKEEAFALKLYAERIAQANSLASSASNMAIKDPTKSFLLAKEAISIYKTPEACNALFMAFISAPFYRSISCKLAKVFPNGKYIAVINDNDVLEVIDWSGKQVYQKLKIPYSSNIEMTDVKINSNNQSIIVNSKSKFSTCDVYYLNNKTKTDIYNKVLLDVYKKDVNPIELGISHNGKIYSIYSKGNILIYEIEGQNITFKNQIKFSKFIPSEALFCQDNNTMILWDTTQILFLDVKKKRIIDKIENQNGIMGVQLSNKISSMGEGLNYLYFYSKDGDFVQYLMPSMGIDIEKLPKVNIGGNSIPRGISDMFFSTDDEEMMILHYNSNTPLIRSTQMLHPDYNLSGGHSSEVLCGSFSKNNSYLITGGEDNLAVVWNKDNLKFTLKGHTKPLSQVFLSDDGSKALTVSIDETAKFWNLKLKDFSMYKDAIIRFNPKTNSYECKVSNIWTNTHITPEFIIENIERPNEQH